VGRSYAFFNHLVSVLEDLKLEVRNRLLRPKTPTSVEAELTQAVTDYLGHHMDMSEAYQQCTGVLECVKLELYRRVIAKYEIEKAQANGDVFNP